MRNLFLTATMYCGSGLKKDLIVFVVISLLSNLSVFDRFVYIFVWWRNIFTSLRNWTGLSEIYLYSWFCWICRAEVYFYVTTKFNCTDCNILLFLPSTGLNDVKIFLHRCKIEFARSKYQYYRICIKLISFCMFCNLLKSLKKTWKSWKSV